MQVQDNGDQRPVCFASRALTAVEQRYAVIEKEAPAATWACDKFADYVLGMTFTLETDHKPLVPLLSSTDLAKMPPRIQRFRMCMMRYNLEVQYVQGHLHVSADALSCAPVGSPSTATHRGSGHICRHVKQCSAHICSQTSTDQDGTERRRRRRGSLVLS